MPLGGSGVTKLIIASIFFEWSLIPSRVSMQPMYAILLAANSHVLFTRKFVPLRSFRAFSESRGAQEISPVIRLVDCPGTYVCT